MKAGTLAKMPDEDDTMGRLSVAALRSIAFSGLLAFALVGFSCIWLAVQRGQVFGAELPADATAAIATLIHAGNLEAAATETEQQMDRFSLSQDETGRWAELLSKIRLARMMRASALEEAALLAEAIAPLDRILTAYPEHSRSFWLRFQRLMIDAAVARRQGLSAIATPEHDAGRLTALAAVIQTSNGLRDLLAEVTSAISVAFQNNDTERTVDSLMSLRNAIATERVRVLLARGELFGIESDDFLAAAEEADRAAVDALAMIRNDSIVQQELLQLRSEALRRMGQPAEAAKLLRPMLSPAVSSVPTDSGPSIGNANRANNLNDALFATAVRIAIDLEQWDGAKQFLDRHYGEQPATAPAAPELDIARLRYLIQISLRDADDKTAIDPNQQRQIGQWIETVGRRGGDFALRRAQTVAVELLGALASRSNDSRIVIAEAAAKMRAGDIVDAANLLADAARTTADDESAQQLAITGAAAYSKAQQDRLAAQLLYEIADKHPNSVRSSDLMLQAAVIIARLGDSAHVDSWLQQIIDRWPKSPSADRARQWQVARWVAAGKLVQAAIAVTPTRTDGSEAPGTIAAQWAEATERWLAALVALELFDDEFQLNRQSREVIDQALQAGLQQPSPESVRFQMTIATLFGDGPHLQSARFLNQRVGGDGFIDWLYSVRSGRLRSDEIVNVAVINHTLPYIRSAAAKRLVADGRRDASRQSSLASPILALTPDTPATDPAHGQALIWRGDWQNAEVILDQWIGNQPPGEKRLRSALWTARALVEASSPQAKTRGLQRYLLLGDNLATDDPLWHTAKLATISALIQTGDPAQAKRLAQYVLLTRPPNDPEVELRFRELAQ